MKKKSWVLVVFFALVLSSSNLFAQNGNWITIDKALEKVDEQHQFIFVEIYTDWCGWCKKLDESTFSDQTTINNLKSNFVLVKLNAEAETPIIFKNKTYSLIANGNRKTNELALNLGSISGRIGYPTLVVLDNQGNKIQAFPGYKDPDTINQLVKYFTSESYKTMDFLTFQAKN